MAGPSPRFAPNPYVSILKMDRLSTFQSRSPEYNSKLPAAKISGMSRMEDDGLRILAQYERRKTPDTEAYLESLRVDGQGIIPRADPKYCVKVTVKDDPGDYRFPIPAEFNKRGSFVIGATDLPVTIPYDADVKISIIETNRKGEKILAQSPLRYRTS
jgi:hypothetical protein